MAKKRYRRKRKKDMGNRGKVLFLYFFSTKVCGLETEGESV